MFGLNRFFSKRETQAEGSSNKKGVSVQAKKVQASGVSALKVAACYHALDLRANTLSLSKICVERNKNGVWSRDVRDITGARDFRHLQYMLEVKPNEYMTADQMWRQLSVWRDTEGLAAIYIPGGAKVAYMAYPVHRLLHDYTTNTWSCTLDCRMQQLSNIPASELIILRGMYYGGGTHVSLTTAAQGILSLYLTADNFATETLAKGGTMKMFVSEEGGSDPLQGIASLSDSEVKSAVDDVREQVAANDDVIFLQGVKTESRSQSFQDLQIDQHKRAVVEDVARMFGIPLPLMFTSTNAVYKSIDDAFHTFVGLTIRPLLEELEQELNAKLLGEENYGVLRFRFDTSELCLDSESTRAITASTRRNAGITTANEERSYMGLQGIEGGDELTKPNGQPMTTRKGGEE